MLDVLLNKGNILRPLLQLHSLMTARSVKQRGKWNIRVVYNLMCVPIRCIRGRTLICVLLFCVNVV